MCEWLSHSDWCDVRLVCGGRTFNAHRAVLASVSRFLRQILLSCPANESPTFIVLPDFDLDAMSSVLYYIYNGEVVVQNDKLDMFLDIIKTMQIFIDNRYLPNESDKVEFEYLHCKRSLDKINIFKLGHLYYEDQPYVNIKKGKADNLQCSQSLSDCSDRTVRRQNLSEKRQAALGNLKSPFGDRQSNSFLRDLFIETYPRNGNVNGLAAGVLAISNECYQAPASALLTNANVKHLGADDSLSKPYKKTVEHIKHSPSVFHPHKPRCPDDQPDNQEINQLYDPAQNICSMNFENINKHDSNKVNLRSANVWLDHVPMQTDSLCRLRLQEQILTRFYVPSLDINVSPPMLEAMKSLQNIRSPGLGTTNERSKEKQKLETVTKSTTILNQVMRNPWCPRIPTNYKPFRRKVDATKSSSINQRELSDINHNDSNNNEPDIVKDEITTPKEESTVAMVLPAIIGKEDFKCTVCKQVFTNDDTLSAHMRRHTSNARYTCGECGKTFSQLRNFKYHMSIHRGTREFAATCSVCGKYFNDRGYLSSHMKIHRNRKEYKCNQCPKSFNQRVAYNMHVRIHTGVKPHVCEECGKAFSRKMLLKQHQRTHSGERPYACPHCDKRFADRSNMTLHLRLHTGVKPFSCTLCPKSFTKKHHLKSHLNFHTGSKPYSCPRCNLAFTQSSNMRTHMKKCNASEPLSECPQINNVLKST